MMLKTSFTAELDEQPDDIYLNLLNTISLDYK